MAIPLRPAVRQPAESAEARLEKAEQRIARLEGVVDYLTNLALMDHGENPLPLTAEQRQH